MIMKKSFKVRRGLESPLKIWGMEMKYFYTYCIIMGGMIIYLTAHFISLSQDLSQESIVVFGITFFVLFIIALGLKFWLAVKSETKAITFGKRKIVVSNKDILNSIK